MKISCIYTITNTLDGKIYVGYTNNFFRRVVEHKKFLKENCHYNQHLQCAYNKYGKENFIFEILVECIKEFLYSEEHYWCNMLNAHDERYGYNIDLTHPSKKFAYSSENQKRTTSLRFKGIPKSPEQIKKMVETRKANGNYKQTDEIKAKIAITREINKQSGNYISPNLGKKDTIETRNKKRESKLGTKQSIEWVEKRTLPRRRKVIQIDKDTDEEIRIFDSISGVAKQLEIPHSNDIISVCRGRQKTAYGFKWRYEIENRIEIV